ncbi:hypothetical protein [Salsuginibacillus kocurii]|uniref:hypothetical protein n=1 Tax=Salsuginibacillus kocurii TaxID=427078 RepID=UPI0003767424|nr:hypothetical protein [Salsuginibacillus kocurii]
MLTFAFILLFALLLFECLSGVLDISGKRANVQPKRNIFGDEIRLHNIQDYRTRRAYFSFARAGVTLFFMVLILFQRDDLPLHIGSYFFVPALLLVSLAQARILQKYEQQDQQQ